MYVIEGFKIERIVLMIIFETFWCWGLFICVFDDNGARSDFGIGQFGQSDLNVFAFLSCELCDVIVDDIDGDEVSGPVNVPGFNDFFVLIEGDNVEGDSVVNVGES